MNNRLKAAVAMVSAIVIVCGFSACGKKPTSQTGENIVPSTQDGKNYEVQLDERSDKTQYEYGDDDLSFIDTVSGKRVSLGMTEQEIEAVAGAPEQTDGAYRIYDGIVVKYSDGAAVSLIVSNGQFKDGKEKRYFSSRGVGIGTLPEDFKKAYGDSYTEGEASEDGSEKEASRAVRYFEKDGAKIEFLGTKLTDEQKSADKSNYYIQDFMFSNADGTIATMRVSKLSAATGGK